jgi:hypothetical protein
MRTSYTLAILLAALALPLILFQVSHAEPAASEPSCATSCHQCGCGQLKKVCRMVPEIKKETVTKWVLVCEDVCLPGRSCKVGEKCVPDCDSHKGFRMEDILKPTCGPIVTKKKLKQVTETIEKPGYKCVVETICSQCGCCCDK